MSTPAYPTAPDNYKNGFNGGTGLSKRELIAAMAMQALVTGMYAGNNHGFTVQGNCVAAVEYADALLKELDKVTK